MNNKIIFMLMVVMALFSGVYASCAEYGPWNYLCSEDVLMKASIVPIPDGNGYPKIWIDGKELPVKINSDQSLLVWENEKWRNLMEEDSAKPVALSGGSNRFIPKNLVLSWQSSVTSFSENGDYKFTGRLAQESKNSFIFEENGFKEYYFRVNKLPKSETSYFVFSSKGNFGPWVAEMVVENGKLTSYNLYLANFQPGVNPLGEKVEWTNIDNFLTKYNSIADVKYTKPVPETKPAETASAPTKIEAKVTVIKDVETINLGQYGVIRIVGQTKSYYVKEENGANWKLGFDSIQNSLTEEQLKTKLREELDENNQLFGVDLNTIDLSKVISIKIDNQIYTKTNNIWKFGGVTTVTETKLKLKIYEAQENGKSVEPSFEDLDAKGRAEMKATILMALNDKLKDGKGNIVLNYNTPLKNVQIKLVDKDKKIHSFNIKPQEGAKITDVLKNLQEGTCKVSMRIASSSTQEDPITAENFETYGQQKNMSVGLSTNDIIRREFYLKNPNPDPQKEEFTYEILQPNQNQIYCLPDNKGHELVVPVILSARSSLEKFKQQIYKDIQGKFSFSHRMESRPNLDADFGKNIVYDQIQTPISGEEEKLNYLNPKLYYNALIFKNYKLPESENIEKSKEKVTISVSYNGEKPLDVSFFVSNNCDEVNPMLKDAVDLSKNDNPSSEFWRKMKEWFRKRGE